MRKYLFIFGALLAYLLFCSKSCNSNQTDDSDSPELKLGKIKDSIRSEFESDDLSKKTLRAFETKAKEKLCDLSDYLNLYNDKSLDDILKNQARKMILELFVCDTVSVKMKVSTQLNEKSPTIKELLSLDFSAGCDSVLFYFDTIGVLKPLRRKDELTYAGTLKFSKTLKGYSSSGLVFTNFETKKIEMMAVKVNKQFGADTLQIWKVLLGKIE